jgi:membrane-bound lytic murein transglycosylase A
LRSCAADPELPHAADALAFGSGANANAARAFFEDRFLPHVIAESGSPGFVTGYYEPEIEGSYVRGGPFQVPVYRRPKDLITLAPETERARFNDRITGLWQTDQGQVPYYARAEIWDGALSGRGLELLYLKDMVELFYMQVQGSGRVHLKERGAIAPDAMSMAAVKAWLRADEARGRALMEENRSYGFFRELEADEGRDGPRGAQGVALTPGRSLAVDTVYHRLGLPVFVTAVDLVIGGQPFRRLMIAQDVGSAIRGPERGDIFWGTGEDAGAIAGSTRHAARFHVLMPKR